MWDMIVFLLEGIVFILDGLELPYVVQTLPEHRIAALAADAALVSLTVIGVRLALTFLGLYLIRAIRKFLVCPRLCSAGATCSWSPGGS
jgi:CPA1 family monovalent cation:H+ antiporter